MNIKEAIVYFKNYIKVKKEVIRDREEEGLIVDSRYTKQLEEMVEAFEMVLAELEKKDKIINLMAKYIARFDIEEDICLKIEDNCYDYAGQNGKLCEDCIKQYFERKVEK